MKPLLLLRLSLLFAMAIYATSQTFTCRSPSTCRALIGYVPTNKTTLSSIKTLFGVKNLRSILAANSLRLSTRQDQPVEAGSTVRVPFLCNCSNGTGLSNRTPVYKVKPGDGLDSIARVSFSGFVTYEQIAAVNNISDPNLIVVGQQLWIPLPCSCDDVDGMRTVHYGHVVVSGSSLEQIAVQFGTTAETLQRLNGIEDPRSLLAGAVLDVPLKACNSTISNTSLDYPLLVPNGSYALTANNCVQCSCDSEDWQLQCKPSQGLNVSKWSECPPMQCDGGSSTGNLFIGNTSSPTVCELTTCAYTGYTNSSILASFITQSTCHTDGAPLSQPSSNFAPEFRLRGLSWRWFIFLHLSLLCFLFLC